jgi:hypothetical protein
MASALLKIFGELRAARGLNRLNRLKSLHFLVRQASEEKEEI